MNHRLLKGGAKRRVIARVYIRGAWALDSSSDTAKKTNTWYGDGSGLCHNFNWRDFF